MTSKNPAISVVCPTWNSEKFIHATLASVFDQSVAPYELIIVDDGSTDETLAAVENIVSKNSSLVASIISRPHRGPGAARNEGIRHARGEWIAFLDSDDRWERSKIERVSEAIQQHPSINFLCHSEIHVRKDGSRALLDYGARYRTRAHLGTQLFRNNLFSPSAVACKKNLFFQYGFFDETLLSAQDYELWLKLSPHMHPHFMNEQLGYYIDRADNVSLQKPRKRFVNILRALSRNRSLVRSRVYHRAFIRCILACIKEEFLWTA